MLWTHYKKLLSGHGVFPHYKALCICQIWNKNQAWHIIFGCLGGEGERKASIAAFIALQLPWLSHYFLFVLFSKIATTELRIVLDYVSRILQWTILKPFCHYTWDCPVKRKTSVKLKHVDLSHLASLWRHSLWELKIRKGCGR